jgi:E3 ubiquitin-protein ligase BRE1
VIRRAAENEAADLKRQLDARSSSTTEAELIARAASLQEQLDALKALLEGASSGEDVQSRLQDYTQKVATMRLELDAAAESTTALCDEVDRLSAAYADVERLANAKVLDVVHAEDKLLRLTTEKSKADNKYFSAMRAKDAVDAERKLALRTAERQGKALERAADAERLLIAQLAAGEREGALRRRAMDEQAAKLVEAERDAKLIRIREAEALRAKTHAEARLAALFPQQSEETRALAREREARVRLEKDLEKAKRDLEASTALASASAAGSAIKARKTSTSDADTQVDYLNVSPLPPSYRSRCVLLDADAALPTVAAALLGMQGPLPRPHHHQVPAHVLLQLHRRAHPDAPAQVPPLRQLVCHERRAAALLCVMSCSCHRLRPC